MFHDLIRDMKVVSVFDERTGDFGRNRAAADGDIRGNIRGGAVDTADGLQLDRLEEEIHRLQEPLTSTGGSRLDNPFV